MNVSVCIPSYNHGRFLRETLDSVLAQTYTDYEVIFVDDGSSDNSVKIAREYVDRFSQMTLVPEEHRGMYPTYNRAIHLAQGKYIAILESDNAWIPSKLKKQMAYVEKHPETKFLYGFGSAINAKGILTGDVRGKDISDDPNQMEAMIPYNVIVTCSSLLIERKVFDTVGFFDETLSYGDWEFFVRVFSQYRAVCLPIPLYKDRMHGKNARSGSDEERGMKTFQCLKRMRENFPNREGLVRRLDICIDKIHKRRGKDIDSSLREASFLFKGC